MFTVCFIICVRKGGWVGGCGWKRLEELCSQTYRNLKKMQLVAQVAVCLTKSILNFCGEKKSLLQVCLTKSLCDSQGLCSTPSPRVGSERQEIQGKQIAAVNGIALRRVLSCRPAILALLGTAIVSIPLPGNDSLGVFQRVKKQPACPLLSQGLSQDISGEGGGVRQASSRMYKSVHGPVFPPSMWAWVVGNVPTTAALSCTSSS